MKEQKLNDFKINEYLSFISNMDKENRRINAPDYVVQTIRNGIDICIETKAEAERQGENVITIGDLTDFIKNGRMPVKNIKDWMDRNRSILNPFYHAIKKGYSKEDHPDLIARLDVSYRILANHGAVIKEIYDQEDEIEFCN